MGSKNDVNNDPEESKKTTPLTHFRAPGRPLEPPQKMLRGPEPPSTAKNNFSQKKWPQDELFNVTKIETMAKQAKN